ncbi:hypothetical protein FA95DRAFT_1578921, partial [Auriscalpium vulgare]
VKIEQRLRTDKPYARVMDSISVRTTQGRCSTFRSESYKNALEVNFYQLYKLDKLKTQEKIADALTWLFMQPTITFTYSGDPLLQKYDKDEPFCHPAIAAVLVGAWLKQYQSGLFIKVQFSTTIFSSMYNNLLNDLKRIKAANMLGFHFIMHDLYKKVMGISVEENIDPASAGPSSEVDFKNMGIKKKGRCGN